MSDFRVLSWAAWSPGLTRVEDWEAWLHKPVWPLPDVHGQAPLGEVSSMVRRRLDPHGRAALQVAWWAQGDAPAGAVVFSSRWGEINRSVEMLRQLARTGGLSPTTFSLSVHNANSAQYSIARGDLGNYIAISAGQFSAAAAVCEAVALLNDGAKKVLVVSVEGGLPDPYQSFEENPGPLRAWSVLLGRVERGLQLNRTLRGECCAAVDLPADLATFQFLVGKERRILQCCDQGCWEWSRHE